VCLACSGQEATAVARRHEYQFARSPSPSVLLLVESRPVEVGAERHGVGQRRAVGLKRDDLSRAAVACQTCRFELGPATNEVSLGSSPFAAVVRAVDRVAES